MCRTPNVLDDASFDHFYNLEYDQALAGFLARAAKAPASPDVENHIAQTILFREMFRAGMLQSQMLTTSNSFLKMPRIEMSSADQQQFTEAIGRAMELAQSRLNDDPDNPDALYALGVSYGLRGNYNFAVRKAYLDALHDMGCARKFHNRVTRIDPAMVDAQLTQGVYDYVVGSLSLGWKMVGMLGGFQGSRARGIDMLRRVASGRVHKPGGRDDFSGGDLPARASFGGSRLSAEAADPTSAAQLSVAAGTGGDVRRLG